MLGQGLSDPQQISFTTLLCHDKHVFCSETALKYPIFISKVDQKVIVNLTNMKLWWTKTMSFVKDSSRDDMCLSPIEISFSCLICFTLLIYLQNFTFSHVQWYILYNKCINLNHKFEDVQNFQLQRLGTKFN